MPLGGEAEGQQLRQGVDLVGFTHAAQIDAEVIPAEFPHHLTAHAAGGVFLLRICEIRHRYRQCMRAGGGAGRWGRPDFGEKTGGKRGDRSPEQSPETVRYQYGAETDSSALP